MRSAPSSPPAWPCAALANADLSARTTLKVGGRVEWLLEPATPDELVAAWCAARERGLGLRMLGGGANLIVEDGLHPGVVIATDRLRRLFRPDPDAENPLAAPGAEAGVPALEVKERARDPRLVAWCGTSLPALVRAASELGWSGLEGLAGVPGHVGGGIVMNAGGRWGELWDTVELVRVIEPDGTLTDLPRERCAPRYRDANLGERVVVGAVLRLAVSDRATVKEAVRTYLAEKNAVQPVTELSAGCVFKNPDPELAGGRSAGRLVEEVGAKGLRRGDAVVSEKHGNFVVNRGHATATDVLALIDEVRERVAQATGIVLEDEAKRWRVADAAVLGGSRAPRAAGPPRP